MSTNGVKTLKHYTKQSKQEAIITGNKAKAFNLRLRILTEGQEEGGIGMEQVMMVR